MRIIVVDAEESTFEVAKELSSEFEVVRCASVVAATALVEEMKPEVVLLDMDLRGAPDFVSWLKKKTGSAVILVGSEPFPNERERWQIDAYLQKPFGAENLADVIRGAAGTPENKNHRERENDYKVVAQEVITVWGAKGGSGRTVIAANLAHYLNDFRVLLIDLNFCEGISDLSVYLDLPKTPHLGNFLDDPRNRRKSFLNLLTMPKRSHFSVIQPPPTLRQTEKISCDDIIDLIDQARRLFQIIIIDLPPNCSPLTLEAVDMATATILVTPTHLGSISRLEALQNFINKDINKGLVVNRYDDSSLKPKEIAHFLDIPLVAVIKEDVGLKRSIDKNCFQVSPNTYFGQGIAEIASNLLGLERPDYSRKRSLIGMFRNNRRR